MAFLSCLVGVIFALVSSVVCLAGVVIALVSSVFHSFVFFFCNTLSMAHFGYLHWEGTF